MWEWVVQNKQWVFSGAGLTVLAAAWWLFTKLLPKSEAAAPTTVQSPTVTQAPSISQAPSVSIAPIITVSPTISLREPRAEPPEVVSPAPTLPATPKPRPNLRIETTRVGRISLDGDIWTLRQDSRGWDRQQRYRALLADISNIPPDGAHTTTAEIRAAIRMNYGGRQRTYSPLPWLEEFTNKVSLETGARKTVVLAVGVDSQTGIWNFVLNHRSDYASSATSAMDWTHPCPIPSELPFEILMMDMNSGAVLSKFEYLWTFDANNNWPILRSVT